MTNSFKKLVTKANQVIIEKKRDNRLRIYIEDMSGDKHILNANVVIDSIQNIDILGEKLEQSVDEPFLNIKYEIEKSKKICSENISMKWNHSIKPSVYEIKSEDKTVFTGTFSDAMTWVNDNVIECNQKIVTKKSLH